MEATRTKSIIRTLMTVILVLAVAFVFVMPQPVYAAVKISQSKATISVDDTVKLSLFGTTKSIKWSSNDKSVATVSKKGTVTGKAEGTAKITAKYGKYKKTCTVTVTKKLVLPKVTYKKYVKEENKVIIEIKNENDVPVSATVKMTYIDPAYVMVVSSQQQDVPVIEPGQHLGLEFNATLNTGSQPQASVIKVDKVASNIVTKRSELTVKSISEDSQGAMLEFTNTSDVDVDYVEGLALFKDANKVIRGMTKVAIHGLKAGESQTVLAKRPASVPSTAKYKLECYRNYSYAE